MALPIINILLAVGVLYFAMKAAGMPV